MELNKLEQLLAKYDNGETTLAEEARLQEYFSKNQVPEHLRAYQSMFRYSAGCKAVTYQGPVKTKAGRKPGFYMMTGVAASIMLAIGVFSWQSNLQQDMSHGDLGTIESPEQAYEKTKEALQMMAMVFDTGREELQYLNQIDKTKEKYFNQ